MGVLQTKTVVTKTFTITTDEGEIQAIHETGDGEIYVWRDETNPREIALALTASEARDLADALVALADKAEAEEAAR